MRTTLIWTAAMGAMWCTSTIAWAQEKPQGSPPVAKKAKVDPRKVFREIHKRMDAFYTKCDLCKGRGTVIEKVKIDRGRRPARTKAGPTRRAKVSECRKCKGKGWVPVLSISLFSGPHARGIQGVKGALEGPAKHQELLDAFLDYFELADRHADALSQKKYRRLAGRVHEKRSRFLNEILDGIEFTVENVTGPPVYVRSQWRTPLGRQRGGTQVYPTKTIDGGYTALTRSLILGKASPIGHGIAFKGEVLGVSQESGRKIAEVLVKGFNTPLITCFVVVPDGVRWVTDANVRVIGKVIDPSAFAELKKRLPDAVVVQPSFGTE